MAKKLFVKDTLPSHYRVGANFRVPPEMTSRNQHTYWGRTAFKTRDVTLDVSAKDVGTELLQVIQTWVDKEFDKALSGTLSSVALEKLGHPYARQSNMPDEEPEAFRRMRGVVGSSKARREAVAYYGQKRRRESTRLYKVYDATNDEMRLTVPKLPIHGKAPYVQHSGTRLYRARFSLIVPSGNMVNLVYGSRAPHAKFIFRKEGTKKMVPRGIQGRMNKALRNAVANL